MNREIKFRAWHKEKKFMMDVAVIDIKSKTVTSYTDYHCHASDSFIPFDDIVLMECIGLKDKNGKEIYESDILKKTYKSGNSVKAIVSHGEFSNCGCCANVSGIGFNLGSFNEDSEVIGNIYENPELIVELK